jgi:hypothetical protein
MAIAVGMSSPFGVGDVAFRTVAPIELQEVDTVAFGAYKRAAVKACGSMDEQMVRNQDDEYNYRLRGLGRRIFLAPDLHLKYYSRGSFAALWRQYFQYGLWKVRVLQKHARQMSLRQFVPPTFVLGLLFSALLAFVSVLRPISLFVPALYLLANLTASTITASRKGWHYLPYLPLVFAILHLGYGAGFLIGLVKFWNRWGDKQGKTPVLSFTSEA